MIDPDSNSITWALRAVGSMIGVIASLIIVAPEGTRSALWRVWIGVSFGVIFAPAITNVGLFSWLEGDSPEMIMARSATVGVLAWSVLETTVRAISAGKWIDKLLTILGKTK